jgi:uncharacterized membrane protein
MAEKNQSIRPAGDRRDIEAKKRRFLLAHIMRWGKRRFLFLT